MSCSKPLPPFTYDLLCFFNREQLDRSSIVCRRLKNLIERYFHSKPYRIFDILGIRGGSYALIHNYVQWHPKRDDYTALQFLAGQNCSIDEPEVHYPTVFYSFAEMHPYLGPTVRINRTVIVVAGDSTYNAEHIAEMESIAYLRRDGNIMIWCADKYGGRIVAEDFQPILNSPTILQCQELYMVNAYFSFKNYNVLYTVKVIVLNYDGDDDTDSNYWLQFLEQPSVKPIVTLRYLRRENIDMALDRLKEAFSSAVMPSAFKIVFVTDDESLTEFLETNNTTGEKFELKKGLPLEYQKEYFKKYDNYTLERSII